MTNEQILKKAIEKAYPGKDYEISPGSYIWIHDTGYSGPFQLIFSHDFAKAFWGEKEFFYNEGRAQTDERTAKEVATRENATEFIHYIAWQFHLQRMVISEDPIKYLEKFI